MPAWSSALVRVQWRPAQYHRRVHHYPRPILPPHVQHFGVGVPAKRLKRRDIAEGEQGAQRKDERDPATDRESGEYRRRHERHPHIDWQKIREHVWKEKLYGHAQRRTRGRTQQTHRRRLHDVDREDLTTRCAQTAKHGYSVDFARDERANTARASDSAEQQCPQPDDPDEAREVFACILGRHFGLRDRQDAHLLILYTFLERLDELVRIDAGRELLENRPLRGASEDQQLCLGYVPGGDEDARTAHTLSLIHH